MSATLFITEVVNVVNNLPLIASQTKTSQPLALQVGIALTGSLVLGLFISLGLGLIAGLVTSRLGTWGQTPRPPNRTRSLTLSAGRDAHTPAIHGNFAVRTKRTDRLAEILAVGHQQVIEDDPIPPWQFLSQGHLRFVWRFGLHVAKPIRNPMHMRVNCNSRFAERQCHDDICGLAPNARKFEQLFQF